MFLFRTLLNSRLLFFTNTCLQFPGQTMVSIGRFSYSVPALLFIALASALFFLGRPYTVQTLLPGS